jgi:large-conductance mechanosensitive channel
MGRKEEVIIRPAVGIILGISITAFLTAISQDIVTPILKQKSFDDEEKRLVYTFKNGVRINFGDVLGHFITVCLITGSIYVGLAVLEYFRIF